MDPHLKLKKDKMQDTRKDQKVQVLYCFPGWKTVKLIASLYLLTTIRLESCLPNGKVNIYDGNDKEMIEKINTICSVFKCLIICFA